MPGIGIGLDLNYGVTLSASPSDLWNTEAAAWDAAAFAWANAWQTEAATWDGDAATWNS